MKRPRGPGFTYTVLALVLVVLVAALALTARQPPPPTIAEFAPQAVEQITESPDDQSSSVGRGPGGTGDGLGDGGDDGGVGAPLESADRRAARPQVRRRSAAADRGPAVAAVRPVLGGRQRRRDVARASRATRSASPAPDNERRAAALRAFFNKRFEFYGRKLQVHRTRWRGDTAGSRSAPQPPE